MHRAPADSSSPDWVEHALRFPVRFAQVREDPLQDLEIVEAYGPRAAVMMIASGGCTVAALAGSERVSRLHLVDPNPAQLALSRLKLRMLESVPPSERHAL